MNILAIDTANSACSVTLKKGDEYFSLSEPALRGQAELLLGFVDEVLKHGKLSLAELDGLAFSAGPASFTGIRLALSALQGLALAHNLPIIAVNSLHALAQDLYRLHKSPKILVCTNAHMGQLFWAAYAADINECLQTVQAAILVDPDCLPTVAGEGWTAVGNGWAAYKPALEPVLQQHVKQFYADFLPVSAIAVADLAEKNYPRGAQTVTAATPLYLRTAQAWKKAIQ